MLAVDWALKGLSHKHYCNICNTHPPPNARYLDTLQRSEEEYAALKDQIKAAKAATKKVVSSQIYVPVHVLIICTARTWP